MNDKKILLLIKYLYLKYLDREPDDEGLKYFFTQIKLGKLSPKELEYTIQKSPEYLEKIKEYELPENISIELEEILNESNSSSEINDSSIEPQIFVSCYNGKTDFGGVYHVSENTLVPIFEGHGCFGIFFDEIHQILFFAIRKEPQILAFKIDNRKKYSRIPIIFSNYVFAEQVHGITIFNNKIIVIATNGIQNDIATAVNDDVPWKGIGKIIVSDCEVNENRILISNSKQFNPFSCSHHHHINDICEFNNNLFILSHTYCDLNKQYIKKGALSILNEDYQATPLLDKFQHPHSLHSYNDKLFLCSSAIASILSIFLPDKIKLEYKGIDVYTRGLAITKNFLYIGNSFGIGRTNSKFKTSLSGLLKFNRNNGKSDFFQLPNQCDNIYDITVQKIIKD